MSIQSILEENGFETYSYSGRGMYGKSCLAITVSHPNKMFNIGVILGENMDDASDIEVKYDNLGMDYVLYFPYESFVEEKKDD